MKGQERDRTTNADQLPGGENTVRFDGHAHGDPGEDEGAHAMKRHVLFVHGAGDGAHEADEKLAESLRRKLGDAYDVRSPRMPDKGDSVYGAWRSRISRELAAMEGDRFLVGHSFGASVLLKYLTEETPTEPIAGVFLVAMPFWGAEDWEVEEYELPEDFASKLPKRLPVFLYHGREDEVVPFEHLALYEEKLPAATVREVEGRGHQFNDDLSEVARDIENVSDVDRRDGEVGDE